MLGYSSCSWFLLVVETVSQQHTHTHWLWVCHLVQLLCPSFMVCLSNNVLKLFCLDTHLAAVYLLTLYQSVSSARLSSAQTREGRNVMWRGGRDHTRGAPRRAWSDGGRQGVGGWEVWDSFCSAHKQTPYTHHMSQRWQQAYYCGSAQRCTQICMSSQADARPQQTPHVWASHQKLVGKHVWVWTCHLLLLLLNKSLASHGSNLYGNQCWQAVRAWFTAFSLKIGQQWITVRPAADHRRSSVSQD